MITIKNFQKIPKITPSIHSNWHTEDGRVFKILEMETAHLKNCAYKIVRDNWKTYNAHAICISCNFVCYKCFAFNDFYWESGMKNYKNIPSCKEYTAIKNMNEALE